MAPLWLISGQRVWRQNRILAVFLGKGYSKEKEAEKLFRSLTTWEASGLSSYTKGSNALSIGQLQTFQVLLHFDLAFRIQNYTKGSWCCWNYMSVKGSPTFFGVPKSHTWEIPCLSELPVAWIDSKKPQALLFAIEPGHFVVEGFALDASIFEGLD